MSLPNTFDSSADEAKQDRERLIAELGVETRGNTCRCPFHDDKNPSAGIFQSDTGDWLFKCHTCQFEPLDYIGVRAKLDGLSRAEVLAGAKSNGAAYVAKPAPPKAPKRPAMIFPNLDAIQTFYEPELGPREDVWKYLNEDKSVFCYVLRFKGLPGEKKKHRQCVPHEGESVRAEGPPQPHILFNLPMVIGAQDIIVVEGEKCVKALWTKAGIVATTSLAGAGKAHLTDWTPLSGKRVWLWADNDTVGKDHMKDIAKIVLDLPTPPASLFMLKDFYNWPEHYDVADLLYSAERTQTEARELVHEYLEDFVPITPSSALKDRFDAIVAGDYYCAPFLFPSVDQLTQALLPGAITIVVGDAGSTKSFLLLHAAAHWNRLKVQHSILMLEEDAEHYQTRLAAIMAHNVKLLTASWVYENPTLAMRQLAEVEDRVAAIGKNIHTTEGMKGAPDTKGLIAWVESRAKLGDRVIAIDPITAADSKGKPWEVDHALAMGIKEIARKHGCSVIFVTHPTKANRIAEPSMSDIAGGSSMNRFVACILWLESLPPDTESKINLGPMVMPQIVTHNRAMRILKARNGRGSGMRIALQFNGDTMAYEEIGVMVPENKKKKGGAK